MNFEIFVVDNGSTDNTRKVLKEFETRDLILVTLLEKNRGTTCARNIALKKAKGEYILILDSDTKVIPGAIETMLGVLNKNPQIGIVAPQLVFPDDTAQQSYKKFPTVFLKILKAVPLRFLEQAGTRLESYKFHPEEGKLYRVDYCISACWMLRREVFKKVGFFDEKIFYAPEDADYCLRVWLAGFRVVHCPKAKVLHHTQRMTYRNKKLAKEHVKGLWYYFKKYGYWFSPERVYQQIRETTHIQHSTNRKITACRPWKRC